jgi:DNA-binding transcriptional regulator YiaG
MAPFVHFKESMATLLMGSILASGGTTSTPTRPLSSKPLEIMQQSATASQTVVVELSSHQTTAHKVRELHRISGLSWKQIADLFEVSSRSLHLWANGNSMTLQHEQTLETVYQFIQQLDTGHTRENKRWLETKQGTYSPLDLLKRRDYDHARRLMLPESKVARVSLPKPTSTPYYLPSPDILLDATQEIAHESPQRLKGNKLLRSHKKV